LLRLQACGGFFNVRANIARPDDACKGNAGMQDADGSNHRAMPFDAGPQHLIHRLFPPVAGKDLDFAIAVKALSLDCAAYRSEFDHAVAHHAAVVQDVL